MTNTDDLVAKVPWIHGIKTGHTLEAGYLLVSEGTRSGLTLIGSVLGTVGFGVVVAGPTVPAC